MGTITLPNFRVSGTDRARVRLKDGGVYVEWSTMTDIKAWLYSVEQKAISGRFDVRVDPQDGTRLLCVYSAQKPQYLGVNKIILQCKYDGAEKAYDKPLWNFVRWTDDQAGEEITIDDPDIDVEIVAEDMSSSVLDEATAAALAAADKANEAAERIPLQVLTEAREATEAANEAAEAARAAGITSVQASISDNEPGTPSVDAELLNKVLSLVFHHLRGVKGDTGATPNIKVGTVTTGEPGTSVIVEMTGTAEAPVLNITIPQGAKGEQGNTGSSVAYPFELVNNLTTNDATKGLSAAQGVVLDGKVSQLRQKVDEINTQEVDLSAYNLRNFSTKTDGTYGTNVNYKHKVIPVNKGEKYLIKAVGESGGRYAFFNSTANPVSGDALPLVPGTSVVDIPSGDDVFVTIPSECIAIALYYGQDPYPYAPELYLCYSIVALDTKIDGVKDDSGKNDTITRRKLTWQPCGRWGVTLLTMNSGSFVTAGTAYNVVYRPCSEGEMFLCKTTGSFENPIGFCTSIPANGGTYTLIRTVKNTDGEVIVIAPGNGYIAACNDTTGDRDFMLYKLQDADTATLVPHAITDINETANRFLSVDSGSADYGTPVTADSNNYFVSDFIDIGGYVAVALPFMYGTSNLFLLARGLFGAMFYDASKNIHSVVDVTINRAQSLLKAFSIYTVPSGVKYVRFTGHGADEKCMIGYNRAAEASDNLEEVVNDVLRNNAAQTGEKTVFETNPDTEMLQKMVIANKKTDHGSSGSSTIPPLVLAHISDAHGKTSQYSRFLEFALHWKDKGYVDEIVDTGDVVTDTYSNGVSWRDALEGVEDVITVIGNHDTRASATERESADYPAGQNQWQYHSNISLDADLRNDMYDRYFIGPDSGSPYVSNWGVTQPENASTNGYCYFYKDYASRNLRLIGLDVMGYDSTEDTWLQARLAEAKTAGYAVVILAHFCGEVMTGLSCNYTSLFETGTSRTQIDTYNADAHNIPVRVDAFLDAGGVFVGYIIGHYHRDMVNVLTDYPRQLALAVSSGGVTPTRDFTKVTGSKSYDDFQVVSINTYDKTVRLIKVGADTDYYMRKKGTLSVSYEIVTENGVSRVKGVIGEGW